MPRNIIRLLGRFHVVTHANTAFLHIFLWERFKTLRLKQALDALDMVEIEENGEVKVRSVMPYKMRAQRRSGLELNKHKKLKIN